MTAALFTLQPSEVRAFFLHAGSLNASNGRLCIEKFIIYFKDTIEPSTITGCPVDYPQNGI